MRIIRDFGHGSFRWQGFSFDTVSLTTGQDTDLTDRIETYQMDWTFEASRRSDLMRLSSFTEVIEKLVTLIYCFQDAHVVLKDLLI